MIEAIFDTNVLVDALNGVPAARHELTRIRGRFISRITWIEIMAGGMDSDGRDAAGFLGYFTITEISEEVARRAAAIRAEHRRIGLSDAIVWASAQVSGRILITRNTRIFPARLPGIRVPYTL